MTDEEIDRQVAELLRHDVRSVAEARQLDALFELRSARLELRALREGICLNDGCDEPIHHYFGLTYAQYLAIPRSVLQSMPKAWQARFVDCLTELDSAIDFYPDGLTRFVRARDNRGRFIPDPFADYESGRRVIPARSVLR